MGSGMPGMCCEGLDGVGVFDIVWGRCEPLFGGYYCVDCGNGICEEPEDKCNCPEDCLENKKNVKKARKLIKKYVRYVWLGECYDCLEPGYDEILALKNDAVIPLIEAFNETSRAYIEKRSGFTGLLAQIGDARAYPLLRDLYVQQETETRRWRYAIEAGACVDLETISDFLDAIFEDETSGGLQALKEMSGQDFGKDKSAWLKFLNDKNNLDVFKNNCQQRSAPILG